MDRIETAPPDPTPTASPVPTSTEPAGTAPAGSQARIPAVLLWLLAAALALRIVTAFADRGKTTEETGGLVRWQPAARALSLASATRRPVLYDFTAAWCPPCKRLDHDAWEDDEVAARIGQLFIPSRIVDRQREDGKNTDTIEALQQRYKIDVFPTLIVADSNGQEVSRMTGYAGRDQFDQFLKETAEKIRR